MPEPYDLAIVGAGPVGVTAAALAGLLGLRTIVFDRTLEPYDKPRAMGFDHDVMRVFQAFGLADALGACTAPYRASVYRGLGGKVIKHVDAAPLPHLLGHPPNVVFLQPELEAVLRKRVASLPGVTMSLGTEVTRVTRIESRSALLETSNGNFEAGYVMACDGGGSALRNAEGLEFDDLSFDQPWVVVDAYVEEEALAKLPQTNVQVCDPARPTTFVIGPRNVRRWEFMLLPGDPPDITSDEGIRRLLAAWLPPESYTLWRAAAYRFHALVLRTWRKGNMFFAGDAAHMTPPFLAQGMCQGIRDAQNLVWKLALVQRGLAAPALLDSYEMERSPHVRATTEVAKSFGNLICELSEERAKVRDAELRVNGDPAVQVRQALIPHLEKGFFDSRPGARGRVFPQPRLKNGKLLDDAIGGGFRLVYRKPIALGDDLPAIVRKLSITCVELGKDVIEEAHVLSSFLDQYGHHALLVRPDHYVFGGASDTRGAHELLGELERALAAPHSRSSS